LRRIRLPDGIFLSHAGTHEHHLQSWRQMSDLRHDSNSEAAGPKDRGTKFAISNSGRTHTLEFMLRAIIEFSLQNKFVILLPTLALTLVGIFAIKNIPLDAIPDLSDTQVIIYTQWEGQAPQIVQDQVTYPITTKMLSVPRAKVVRGYSFYGFSFVYVIF